MHMNKNDREGQSDRMKFYEKVNSPKSVAFHTSTLNR